MERLLNLLHGNHFLTPTKNEFFMYNAYVSSTRSASLNRQVGAVIVSNNHELLSSGCNEVPKYGGGQYWSDDKNVDKRDLNKNAYLNEIEKIAKNIYSSLLNENLIFFDDTNNTQSKAIDCIKNSTLSDSLEFFREEHAEASAIIACARNRLSTIDSIMYSTTFPCHLCIKSIINAGIKRVYFIEPFPKSKVYLFEEEILVDAINENEVKENKKVIFKQFIGVGPKRYLDFFSRTLSWGYELDIKKGWSKKLRVPSNTYDSILLNFLISINEKNLENSKQPFVMDMMKTIN